MRDRNMNDFREAYTRLRFRDLQRFSIRDFIEVLRRGSLEEFFENLVEQSMPMASIVSLPSRESRDRVSENKDYIIEFIFHNLLTTGIIL